jgi:hypothetical protein
MSSLWIVILSVLATYLAYNLYARRIDRNIIQPDAKRATLARMYMDTRLSIYSKTARCPPRYSTAAQITPALAMKSATTSTPRSCRICSARLGSCNEYWHLADTCAICRPLRHLRDTSLAPTLGTIPIERGAGLII